MHETLAPPRHSCCQDETETLVKISDGSVLVGFHFLVLKSIFLEVGSAFSIDVSKQCDIRSIFREM